jgi:hypothetical protein
MLLFSINFWRWNGKLGTIVEWWSCFLWVGRWWKIVVLRVEFAWTNRDRGFENWPLILNIMIRMIVLVLDCFDWSIFGRGFETCHKKCTLNFHKIWRPRGFNLFHKTENSYDFPKISKNPSHYQQTTGKTNETNMRKIDNEKILVCHVF